MQGCEHIPSQTTRSLVSSYKTSGATHEQIAAILEISTETLAKHYELELSTARTVYTQKVFGKLAEKIEEGSEPSIFFYLARIGGWKSADKELEAETQRQIAAEAQATNEKLNEYTAELRAAKGE